MRPSSNSQQVARWVLVWLAFCQLFCSPGARFNIKMTSYQYRKSHCGDKMILRPSYLQYGISYTGKMTSLYWIRAQGVSIVSIWDKTDHGPLARYIKNCRLRIRRECRERFPRHRRLAIPTCITARASLAVSFEVGGRENVHSIPGACTTRNFTYLVRCPWYETRLCRINPFTEMENQSLKQCNRDVTPVHQQWSYIYSACPQ